MSDIEDPRAAQALWPWRVVRKLGEVVGEFIAEVLVGITGCAVLAAAAAAAAWAWGQHRAATGVAGFALVVVVTGWIWLPRAPLAYGRVTPAARLIALVWAVSLVLVVWALFVQPWCACG